MRHVATAVPIALLSTLSLMPRPATAGQSRKLGLIHVESSASWISDYAADQLLDRCACASTSKADSDSELLITYQEHQGVAPGVLHVQVNSKLLSGKDEIWTDSRNWIEAGPDYRKETEGLVSAMLARLSSSYPEIDTSPESTQAALKSTREISIVPSGLWDKSLADKWRSELRQSKCPQSVTESPTARVQLKHIETKPGEVSKTTGLIVNCSSDPYETSCTDNMGGESSTLCIRDHCTASSISGYEVDQRPDLDVSGPEFGWIFTDSKTGNQIGSWEIRTDSLSDVLNVMGCAASN